MELNYIQTKKNGFTILLNGLLKEDKKESVSSEVLSWLLSSLTLNCNHRLDSFAWSPIDQLNVRRLLVFLSLRLARGKGARGF